MFKEFIEKLANKADQLGLKAEPYVETYTRRYNLGLEAGFNEEEVVKRFGNIDEILKQHNIQPINDNRSNLDSLEIELINADEVRIIAGNRINVELEEEDDSQYLDIVCNEQRIIVKDKETKNMMKWRSISNVTITIPQNTIISNGRIECVSTDFVCQSNLTFDKLTLSNVSGDTEIEQIKCNNAEISSVSGDINIRTLVAIDCELSTVSGDITIDKAGIRNLGISTISGDADISGLVDKVDSSSISGEISINHQNQKTSLEDAISSMFKF